MRFLRQYPNIPYSIRTPFDSWITFQYYMGIVFDRHVDKYWGPFISRKDAENFHAHLGVFDIILLNIFSRLRSIQDETGPFVDPVLK